MPTDIDWLDPPRLIDHHSGYSQGRFGKQEEFSVILEVAILDVKSGMEAEFEQAFGQAQQIIASMRG